MDWPLFLCLIATETFVLQKPPVFVACSTIQYWLHGPFLCCFMEDKKHIDKLTDSGVELRCLSKRWQPVHPVQLLLLLLLPIHVGSLELEDGKTMQMASRRWTYLIKSSSMTLMTLTFKVGRQNRSAEEDEQRRNTEKNSRKHRWASGIVLSIKGEKPQSAWFKYLWGKRSSSVYISGAKEGEHKGATWQAGIFFFFWHLALRKHFHLEVLVP